MTTTKSREIILYHVHTQSMTSLLKHIDSEGIVVVRVRASYHLNIMLIYTSETNIPIKPHLYYIVERNIKAAGNDCVCSVRCAVIITHRSTLFYNIIIVLMFNPLRISTYNTAKADKFWNRITRARACCTYICMSYISYYIYCKR